jgi:hypothetical protein
MFEGIELLRALIQNVVNNYIAWEVRLKPDTTYDEEPCQSRSP